MMSQKINILVVFFYVSFAFGQSTQDNFISYRDKITTGISYFDSSSRFFLSHHQGEKVTNIIFEPNMQKQLIAELSYMFLNISLGFTPYFLKSDKFEQRTKQFNTGFVLNYKKWHQSVQLGYRKGYRMQYDNTIGFYPLISTLKIVGVTSWIHNSKFSYKSLIKHTEWQRKSAGSFVANVTINYTKFNFKNNEGIAKLYSMMLSPSYYYNFIVQENIMISLGVVAGAGISFSEQEISPTYEFNTHLRLGYNQKRFFVFLGLNTVNFIQKVNKSEFNDFYQTVRMGGGYRFNSPKKMEKTFNKVEKMYKNIFTKIPKQ